MNDFEALLAQYDYTLTKELIALTPAEPRDSAKLLIFERAKNIVTYSSFANLADFIPKGALMVFNDTKVIPARLSTNKKTGGVVEILCTEIDETQNTCIALSNKRIAKGEVLSIGKTEITVLRTEGSYYTLEFDTNIMETIEHLGITPIPPYLKYTPLTEEKLRERYQSLFAKNKGSIAAPTASLHFTEELFNKLSKKGVNLAHITLHVNLGTFSPLTKSAIYENKLHCENFSISAEAAEKINAAKKARMPIIAVGTTAARTLESAAESDGSIKEQNGKTRLFIRAGYRFKVIDGLITNFHVPRSSLLMLVSALVGRKKLFELYKNAADHDFRFLSFGDGMLII